MAPFALRRLELAEQVRRAGSPSSLIGFFGWAGHQLLIIAHRYAPASALAPFVYVQIV